MRCFYIFVCTKSNSKSKQISNMSWDSQSSASSTILNAKRFNHLQHIWQAFVFRFSAKNLSAIIPLFLLRSEQITERKLHLILVSIGDNRQSKFMVGHNWLVPLKNIQEKSSLCKDFHDFVAHENIRKPIFLVTSAKWFWQKWLRLSFAFKNLWSKMRSYRFWNSKCVYNSIFFDLEKIEK